MRKVVFKIDDLEYFKTRYNLTDEQMSEIFTQPSFKAIYTLYGTGNCSDRYELTDHDGNKIKLENLNGYQRGVVLHDCHSYFGGWSYHSNTFNEPFGVISIEETEISTEQEVSQHVA